MRAEMKVLVANAGDLNSWQNAPLQQPFDPLILSFLSALSAHLLRHYREHSELVALGFWLRDSQVAALQQRLPAGYFKPVGRVLHITPNNVDTMFAYSWVCALVMGNNSLVRIGQPDAEQVNLLLSAIDAIFAEQRFAPLAAGNAFVHYPRDSQFSAQVSAQVDARVLWGGDDTVNAIRALACQPRCRDISFADRYSAALIQGDALTDDTAISDLADSLWRDTQPYFQQACSSPRVLFWLGDTAAMSPLMTALEKHANNVVGQSIEWANNQLVYEQLLRNQDPGARTVHRSGVCGICVEQFHPTMLQWHLGQGCFVIQTLNTMNELPQRIDAKLQTLSYHGVEKAALVKLCEDPSITGIDRIVPVGRALDFSPLWDGYDVLTQLSRQIVLE
ncbi:hypothetical protein LJ739_02510 [Aestuariibacter halophilus]|uniref:Long-chain-fatty-acyl-CoA reductase n=1 Tax=Fluctibacter halophilus TaxID=226011 RepID=A0ABS8G603_9ALTE|nr:acyl-CoA reductase [Aestuariibacter halophilus]MCC2615114.1 hypothetical protein [Aestuariibacter halophilus]